MLNLLFVLATAGATTTAAAPAQQKPAAPAAAAQNQQPEEGIGPAEPGTRVTDYLAAAPDSLRLTSAQRSRLAKVREWLRSQNTPLRDSLRAITGGRAFRNIPPAERNPMVPRIQPLMARIRANDQAALDSVDQVLTPEQQVKLRELRAEYRAHHGRPAAPGAARPGRRG